MMEDRNNPRGDSMNHPDWNELARLADEGLDAVNADVLDHLAGCGECQSAWAEAARYNGARVLGEEGYFVPEELASKARALIGSTTTETTSQSFWRPATTFSMGGALLAAVLALFVLLPGLRGTDRMDVPTRPDDPRTLIHAVLESQSAWGMVYPGVAGLGDSGNPVYRSGDGANASLGEALEQISAASGEGPLDSDETWWLAAGNVVAGRLGLASDLVHRALRQDPDHLRLLHLEAITAWQLSEFDRAEHALLRILALAPSDSTALFNLALVKIETGRGNQAEALIQKMAAGSSNSLLEKRAQEILKEQAE